MRRLFLFAAFLLVTTLSVSCGVTVKNSNSTASTTASTTDTTTSSNVTLSGTVSETTAKPLAKPGDGSQPLHAAMGGGEVKVINSKGEKVGSSTIGTDGSYSVSVPKGSNYTIRATKGNVCLKSFVEKADSGKTVTVDPKSSAVVKTLGKKLGKDKLGEEGEDVSTAIGATDVSAIVVAINSSNILNTIAQAIASNISANADYTATTVTVGATSTAGDDDANSIAITITITITITTTGTAAPAAPTGVSAAAGDGKVTVSWSAATGATSYNLYYSTTSGTAGIKVSGITGTTYTLTGLTNGVTYYLTVTAVGAGGESVASSQVSATPLVPAQRKLPDTGQTICHDYSDAITSCAGTGLDAAYTINPPSYTDNGDGTITDNVTALMWQKQDDATTRTWTAAGTYCTGLALGGHNDWRLPSVGELQSIVDYSVAIPSINVTYFPSTQPAYYWSSTTYAGSPSTSARHINFHGGNIYHELKTNPFYARCVRGQQYTQNFTDNGDGTITDNVTGLMWQKQDDATTKDFWSSAITYCEGMTLGGHSDWRLPNVKELRSIVDDTVRYPSINATYFPNTQSEVYTTSTPYLSQGIFVWYIQFTDGRVFTRPPGGDYARCVRLGQ